MRLGESWELWDDNPVRDGPFAGQPLRNLCATLGAPLLGTRARVGDGCPLLLKLVHARELLSIQVHPDDATARRLSAGQRGKTEAWYVLAAEPEAHLIYGLHPGLDRGAVAAAVAEGTLDRCVAHIPVRAGDVVFVPAGTLHAIGPGIVLCEIQQASQLTYRFYDWQRVGLDGQPRPLHVAEALLALHFPQPPAQTVRPLPLAPGRRLLTACRAFAFEALRGEQVVEGDGESFDVLLATDAVATLGWPGGERGLSPGEAVLVPATLGRYELASPGTVLRAYVPNLQRDVIAPARAAGWDRADLLQLGGRELAEEWGKLVGHGPLGASTGDEMGNPKGAKPPLDSPPSSLWVRPDFAPAALPDAVVFDVDGVLIDVSGSYRRVVGDVAALVVERIYGLSAPKPLVGDEDVAAFKRAGGFNDDWDLAYALTALSLARLRGHLDARSLTDLVAESGGRGLSWLHETVGPEDRPDYPTIQRVFNELYWGEDLLRARLGQEPRYAPQAPGLLRTERSLLPPELPAALRARGVTKLALLTGRVRVEVAMALEILGYRDASAAPFQAIVTAEDGRKPDPDTLGRIVARLAPRAGLYVGDTADDLTLVQRYAAAPLADRVPFYAVLVAQGAERAYYQAAGAHAILSSVAEMPTLLDLLRHTWRKADDSLAGD